MKKVVSVVLAMLLVFSIVPVNVLAAAKLSAPVITLTNVASTGKIKVSWTSVSGAANYEVYRAASKNGTFKNMITKSSTSYINTSATAGKTYYYKVRAVSSNGTKGSFSTVKYRTCDLARPDVKATTSSKGYPKLTWGKITGAESYKVYRATSKNGTYKLMKTTTSLTYTNTSATNGTTYYYKVQAVCSKSAADSAYSLIVNVKAKNAGHVHSYVNHYCSECGKFESGYTGMAKKNSTWYYVKNGSVDTTYNGLAKNDYGWWYITNGVLDGTYYGIAKNDYGYWYVLAGKVDATNKNAEHDAGRRYISANYKTLTFDGKSNLKTLEITAHRVCGDFSLSYEVADTSVCYCTWGDWETYDTCPLYVTAVGTGSTNIKLYFTDTPGQNVTKVTVNVNKLGKDSGRPPESLSDDSIDQVISDYEDQSRYDDSVPRLTWYANEACMRILAKVAKKYDSSNLNTEIIDDIVSDYESRCEYDDSAVRVNWYATEASMYLLYVIDVEIGSDDNRDYIDGIIDDYESRCEYDDSVPRLTWYASESCMLLLEVYELEIGGTNSGIVEDIISDYDSQSRYDDSVPRLTWYSSEACMYILYVIAVENDYWDSYSYDAESIINRYEDRCEYDDSAVRVNWYAVEASMELLAIIAKEI